MADKIPVPVWKNAHRGSSGLTRGKRVQGTLLYPESAEREYASVAMRHANMARDIIKEHLPEIIQIFRESRVDSSEVREDARILSFTEHFSKTIRKMERELAEKLDDFKTDVFIRKVAKRANGTNVRQWKNLIKKTFGVDLDGHYYNKGTWGDLIDRWTEENVGYVRSIPEESLATMRQIIQNGYYEGWGITKIRNEIVRSFGVSKRKAKSLAIDQMGTLCSQITRKQQTDAGCTHYRWKSRNDSRVRESHREYNGKIFSWDDPPPSWYMTKSRGKVYTGRFCHPGEDFCCRCMAIPVFDQDTVNLPVSEGSEEKLRGKIIEQQNSGVSKSPVSTSRFPAKRR